MKQTSISDKSAEKGLSQLFMEAVIAAGEAAAKQRVFADALTAEEIRGRLGDNFHSPNISPGNTPPGSQPSSLPSSQSES